MHIIKWSSLGNLGICEKGQAWRPLSDAGKQIPFRSCRTKQEAKAFLSISEKLVFF